MSIRLQRHIQNSVKHVRWSVLQKNDYFYKTLCSEYTSGLPKLFCSGSQRDTHYCLIYVKLIIVFTPNLEFSPYSEVQHSS